MGWRTSDGNTSQISKDQYWLEHTAMIAEKHSGALDRL